MSKKFLGLENWQLGAKRRVCSAGQANLSGLRIIEVCVCWEEWAD